MNISQILLWAAVICFVLVLFTVSVGIDLVTLGLAFFAGSFLTFDRG